MLIYDGANMEVSMLNFYQLVLSLFHKSEYTDRPRNLIGCLLSRSHFHNITSNNSCTNSVPIVYFISICLQH